MRAVLGCNDDTAPRRAAGQGDFIDIDPLSRHRRGQAIALCLRMMSTRESATQAVAVATLRQIITVVFDRVIKEGLLRVTMLQSVHIHA